MKSFCVPDIDEVIFLSDVHFGVHAASIEWREDMEKYFEKFFIPFVRSEFIAGNNPCVVIAGDYFDSRHKLDVMVMCTGIKIMESIADVCPVYFLVGNHDLYETQSTEITSAKIFDHTKNVTVIYDVSELIIKDDKKLCLIPWIEDYVTANGVLSKYATDADVFVMHAQIAGMKMDNNQPIIEGVNCSAITDRKIYSGHIHTRQSNKNITYLGSPYGLTRSDTGNEKGIYTLTLADGQLVENFYVNTFSPKFTKASYEDIISGGTDPELLKNNRVDLYVKKANASKITDEFIRSLGAKEIAIYTLPDEEVVVTSEMVSHDATIETISTEVLMEQDTAELDKQRLVKLNELYLTKAQEELGGIF